MLETHTNLDADARDMTKLLIYARMAMFNSVELSAEKFFLQFIQSHTFNKDISVYENAEIIFRTLTISLDEEIRLQKSLLFHLATKYQLFDSHQILDEARVKAFCDANLIDTYQEDLLFSLLEMLQNQIICKIQAPKNQIELSSATNSKTDIWKKLAFWRKEI